MSDEEQCAKPGEYQYVWVADNGINRISSPYCEEHIHDAQPSESIMILPTDGSFECAWRPVQYKYTLRLAPTIDEDDDYFHI